MKQLKTPSICNTSKGLFIPNIVIIITNLMIDALLQDYFPTLVIVVFVIFPRL